MGIPGLTTYISNHSERFLENYALHDTYLVIDGNSIGCQLYNWHAKCNCAFGGDYDRYARCVSDFFDELSKCNVTPLVLIDGGCEDKKLKTIISRTKEKIRMASYYTPFSQQRNKFFPLLMRETFKDIMIQKDVKYAQCLFEADNTIAAIARILKCPVLSYDSDFYIYGSLYIPFSTWGHRVIRNPVGNGYVKRCKIYYVEKLFQAYNGLNQPLLPLAAILLGNDYVKQCTFKNFFRHLKLPPTGKRKYNDQQRRIDATFNWLRRHNLNQAVIGILSRLQQQERKNVLNIIETIINSYINAPLNVLVMLNIPIKIFSKASIQNSLKAYKFEGDIYKLTYIEENTNETDLSDDDDEMEREIMDVLRETELTSNEALVSGLPEWFIREFQLGQYPSYFIDLIVRKLYVCPIQIEDYFCTSSIVASLKIISVIYGLLMSEINKDKLDMSYMTRDKNKKIKRYQLRYNNTILGSKLPSLSNLRNVPIIIRRRILNDTLEFRDESCESQIPPSWMLYIATIKYWITQQRESVRFDCHIYSLLFAMLFNIIDHKIGFYRILSGFQHKFCNSVQNIQSKRKTMNYQPRCLTDTTLVDAIRKVDRDDCLIVAAFFVSNFEMDQKLLSQPRKFNIMIVHSFAEFQNCLRHSMHLNALLGYPYEPTKIADVFNGTLLYNLCTNFKRRSNVESYISAVLQDAPSLSCLFNILLLKVKPLFGMASEGKVSKYKKQRGYKRKEHASQEEECKEQAVEMYESAEEMFYDANNPFSILATTQH